MAGKKSKIDEVLRAAIVVFVRYGYDAASMDMIAEASGVARRTLYYQFPEGKDALLTAAVSRLWQNKSSIKQLTRDFRFKQDPSAGLTELGNFLYDFWTSEENIALIRILVRDPGRFPQITHEYFDPHGSGGYRVVVSYMRHLARARLISVTDPVLAARHFTGLIRDPLFWPLLTGEPYTPIKRKKLVEVSVRLFLDGCRTTDTFEPAEP